MRSLAAEDNGSGSRGADGDVPPALPNGVASPVGSARRIRIYLVEDNEIIRENLVATLEELACAQVVGTAVDEWTALQWLCEPDNACDLVIVDIFLKSGSGLGVLRGVAGMQPARRMVILSNYATADMRRKCLELGADSVFDKSNDIDALLQYCNALAARPGGQPGPGDL